MDKSLETICMQQEEIIRNMSELERVLLSELCQYRNVDRENKILADLERSRV